MNENSLPKVYIIILNYNGWVDTIECLESVLRNDYPNYQVIVVDNNSPNNSMEYIKAWAEGKLDVWVKPDHPLRHLSFPPVKKPIPYVFYNREEAEKGGNGDLENNLVVNLLSSKSGAIQALNHLTYQQLNHSTNYPLVLIQTGKNLGFAGGNNVGIRYALAKNDFEYVWLLNNDTVIDREALKYLVYKMYEEESLKANKIGVLGSTLIYYNDTDKIQAIGGGRIIRCLGIPKLNGKGLEVKYVKNYILKNIDYIFGASFFVRKSIFYKIGLMPEDYFMYWEETDWCKRIVDNRYKLSVAIDSKVYHKGSASIGFKSIEQQKIDFRNTLLFYKKFYKSFLYFVIAFKPFVNLYSRLKYKKYNLFSSLINDVKVIISFLRAIK